MEAVVNTDPIKLAVMFNESNLYPLYVPFCRRAYEVKKISRAIKVCVTELHFPIIEKRETVFVGEGIDRLE
jgi:hypothetical protein